MTKGELMAAVAGLPADTEILIQVPVLRIGTAEVMYHKYLDVEKADTEEEPRTIFLLTESDPIGYLEG